VLTYCAENSQTRVRILPQGNVDISAALANEIATAYATNRYVIHKLQRIGMRAGKHQTCTAIVRYLQNPQLGLSAFLLWK